MFLMFFFCLFFCFLLLLFSMHFASLSMLFVFDNDMQEDAKKMKLYSEYLFSFFIFFRGFFCFVLFVGLS